MLTYYEMRGFARYTAELFHAMKEIAGDNVDLYSFSPSPIAPEFLAELEIEAMVFPAGDSVGAGGTAEALPAGTHRCFPRYREPRAAVGAGFR
jgi:hypothetical protein